MLLTFSEYDRLAVLYLPLWGFISVLEILQGRERICRACVAISSHNVKDLEKTF